MAVRVMVSEVSINLNSRIGILYPGTTWDSRFSLSSVVRQHIETLIEAGLEISVLVREGLKIPDWMPPEVNYLRVLPRFNLESDPKESHQLVRQKIKEVALWLTHVFTHDLIALKRYEDLRTPVAELVTELSWVKWLHVLHFNPGAMGADYFSSDSRWRSKNSFYVCLSRCLVAETAKAFGAPIEQVLVLHNHLSLSRTLNISPEIASCFDLERVALSEANIVHPFALTRGSNKQPAHVLFTAAALKSLGMRVHLIFIDPESAPLAQYQQARISLKWLGGALGLKESEVVFTSEIDRLRNGLNSQQMSELLRLSNVLIHSSRAEAGPLTILEAMAHSNLCVVNSKVPSFKDMIQKNCIYFSFKNLSYDNREFSPEEMCRFYRSNRNSYLRLAKKIRSQLRKNPILAAKSRYYKDYGSQASRRQLLGLLTESSESVRPLPWTYKPSWTENLFSWGKRV